MVRRTGHGPTRHLGGAALALATAVLGPATAVALPAGATASPPPAATRLPARPATGVTGPLTGPGPAATRLPARPARGAGIRGAGAARQRIVVSAVGYGTWRATLLTEARRHRHWRRVAGPWPARLGYNGFAPPGQKREGDGRTPSGSFPLEFAFGVDPRPVTQMPWRHAHRYDVWDDDPTSPRYNLWTDRRRHNPGRDPEPLHVRPAYREAIVIGYNRARRPYRGSAIFLHVNHTGPTTGCVSVTRRHLLRLLRWLRPGRHPRIVMGVTGSQ